MGSPTSRAGSFRVHAVLCSFSHSWAANPYPEFSAAALKAMGKTLMLQPGKPAPDFILRGLDGEPVSLSRFKGKAVLMDFWAGWCAPCIRDLPFPRRIEEKTDPGAVVFLKVSLEEEAAWRRAIDEHGIGGVHAHAGGWGADVAKSYKVNHIPSYYLVDSEGMIVERLQCARRGRGRGKDREELVTPPPLSGQVPRRPEIMSGQTTFFADSGLPPALGNLRVPKRI